MGRYYKWCNFYWYCYWLWYISRLLGPGWHWTKNNNNNKCCTLLGKFSLLSPKLIVSKLAVSPREMNRWPATVNLNRLPPFLVPLTTKEFSWWAQPPSLCGLLAVCHHLCHTQCWWIKRTWDTIYDISSHMLKGPRFEMNQLLFSISLLLNEKRRKLFNDKYNHAFLYLRLLSY